MKVSVIITAWNVEDYIRQAIESCVNSDYRDLEIIVIDDCSTDGSLKIIDEFRVKDERVQVIQNEINCGAGMSRSIGVENATGEYVIFLDGDDWLNPDFIKSLVEGAEKTDADIVSGGIVIRRLDGSYDATSYGNTICEGLDKITKFWGEKIVFMNNKLIRRTLFDKVPYCKRRFVEDTPTIIPQLYLANKVAYVDNIGYNYRMQNNSLTHKASPIKYAVYRCLCAQDIISFFEEHDKEILKQIPIVRQYATHINQIKQLKPTPEMIEDFKEDWILFSCRLLSGK